MKTIKNFITRQLENPQNVRLIKSDSIQHALEHLVREGFKQGAYEVEQIDKENKVVYYFKNKHIKLATYKIVGIM